MGDSGLQVHFRLAAVDLALVNYGFVSLVKFVFGTGIGGQSIDTVGINVVSW